MLKIGISTCGDKPINEQELTLMKESGISAIEISRYCYDGFDFETVKKNCDTVGIEIWSFHLPFAPFEEIDPSSLNDTIRENTFKLHSSLIEKASKIGVDKFILHTSAEPIDDSNREERIKFSLEYASRLADFAADYGAIIAVEDLPRSCIGNCSKEVKRFLDYKNKLRVCFDTNHLLGENIVDFIKAVGDKIVTLHVSDFDFVNERHWLPGEGDINWLELYSELIKVGYSGVWMYEIALKPTDTTERRILNYKDFYNNAKEIFEEKTPTPIGKRIENLGMWGPD